METSFHSVEFLSLELAYCGLGFNFRFRVLVRSILSARIDATLLIRLDGCHAKTFSNEQGQELDINLINATKTLHNENLQDLVNIFSFFVVTRERI